MTMKKNAKLLLSLISAAVVSMTVVSCGNNDDNAYYLYRYAAANALVTVKPVGTDSCYFQLDDNTTLNPVNIKGAIFDGKEVRALTNYSYMDSHTGNSRDVYVNWIDSIRTKSTVPTLGSLNDETYGSDPIEIVNDWVTIAEDGYLTLRFRTLSNRSGHVHYVNLVTGVDENDPYTVELRHDAKGDVTGIETDGIIAFNLGALPDTDGEIVKLTLKWKSYSGDKSTTFDYCTRRSSGGNVANVPIDVQSLSLNVD